MMRGFSNTAKLLPPSKQPLKTSMMDALEFCILYFFFFLDGGGVWNFLEKH